MNDHMWSTASALVLIVTLAVAVAAPSRIEREIKQLEACRQAGMIAYRDGGGVHCALPEPVCPEPSP